MSRGWRYEVGWGRADECVEWKKERRLGKMAVEEETN